MFADEYIMVQLVSYDKVDTENIDLQKRAGFMPYGNGELKVMVYVSPRLGDPSLWLYLMSVGGAGFFASRYVMLKSKTFSRLVKKVRNFMNKDSVYLLHGVPSKDPNKDIYRQTLLLWDNDLYETRSKQVLGTFIARHIGAKVNYEMEEEKKRLEISTQKKTIAKERINDFVDSLKPSYFKKRPNSIVDEEKEKEKETVSSSTSTA